MKGRIVFLDRLRVMAVFGVIICHSGIRISDGLRAGGLLTDTDILIFDIINCCIRFAIPLFILISGYLLLPVEQPYSTFYRKRLARVVSPLIIWTVGYELADWWMNGLITGGEGDIPFEEVIANSLDLAVNFHRMHLWFLYMILGLYIVMPVISPWLKIARKRWIMALLGIWVIALAANYLYLNNEYIWGEFPGNRYGLLYYLSGPIGYAILAVAIKRYELVRFWPIGIGLWIAGTILTIILFRNPVFDFTQRELIVSYTSLNVAMIGIGAFLTGKRFFNYSGAIYKHFISSMANYSYGIYLSHLMILPLLWRYFLGLPMIAAIFAVAILTLLLSWGVTLLISRLPFGKYIVG